MQSTPFDTGDLNLHRAFYDQARACQYLQIIQDHTRWSDDSYIAFGRRIAVPRLQAWIADAGIRYSYSNNLLETQSWNELLLDIRQQIEQATHKPFNSVLLTYYRNGEDSVSWHADDEAELGPQPCIVSLSLGASRKFHYRHKVTLTEHSFTLNNGDLLIMQPGFQLHWEHCVLPEPAVDESRINLTFRNVRAVSAPDRRSPAVL